MKKNGKKSETNIRVNDIQNMSDIDYIAQSYSLCFFSQIEFNVNFHECSSHLSTRPKSILFFNELIANKKMFVLILSAWNSSHPKKCMNRLSGC